MKNGLIRTLGIASIALSSGFSSIDFNTKYEPILKEEEQCNKYGVQLYKALFPNENKNYQIPENELKDLEEKLKEERQKEQRNIKNFIV